VLVLQDGIEEDLLLLLGHQTFVQLGKHQRMEAKAREC
jgi:hypothetical protein